MRFRAYAAVVVACGAIAVSASHPAVAEGGFVTFEDPLEHAFSLGLPSRWSAHGGMFRFGYSDFRPMLNLTSPDGKISIRSGDVAVPRAYALPTAYRREGEVDDLGAQAQLIYASYRTGKEYARVYALARFKTLCRSLTPQVSDWSPPAAGRDEPQNSAGSVTYRCDAKAGGPRTAYVYAMTREPNANSLWQVTSLVSFMAPAERVASVHAVLVHGANTFKLSPAWIAHQNTMENVGLDYQRKRQQGRIADLNRQVAQFATRMRDMQAQVNSFERGQAARRSDFPGFDNALNGITPTVDPLNGETRDVWTGPNNGYWENGSGKVVNSNTSPGSGFHELQPH